MPISVNKLTKIEASHRATLKAENLRRRPKKDEIACYNTHRRTYIQTLCTYICTYYRCCIENVCLKIVTAKS